MSDNSNRIKPQFSGEWVKLGELGDFKTGGTPSRKHPEYYSGDIPWISTPALNGGLLDAQDAVQTLTKEGVDHSATKVIPEGSLMVGIRVGIGKVAINAVPMCTNQDIVSIVDIDKSNWNVKYLSYTIQSKANILHSRKRGATITGITTKELKALNIPVLPIAQQLELVRMLDSIKLLELNAKQGLSLIDNLVKSRFIEMFRDPVENDSKLPKCKWEDVLTIVNGKNQKKVECATGEYPICGSGGEMGRARQYLTKGDSVIIGRKGNINNPILMREPFWNVDTAFGLEPNVDILRVEYLYYFCEWFDFQQLNKAVTIPSLTKADLLKIEMPLPPLPLQQEFADFASQVDKLRFRVQQQIEKLEMLKKSLMQEYFGQ